MTQRSFEKKKEVSDSIKSESSRLNYLILLLELFSNILIFTSHIQMILSYFDGNICKFLPIFHIVHCRVYCAV